MRTSVLGAAALLPLLACAPEHEPTAPSSEPSFEVTRATDYRAINLGTLGGPVSHAHGVSPIGHVVGESWTASSVPNEHAFLWFGGVMTDLGTLGGCCSAAYAVNQGGRVVGVSRTASGTDHAFVWKDGVMTDLGPYAARARDVNAAGRVAGNGSSGGFIFYRDVFTPLGAITPAAINANGWVAGQGQSPTGLQRAFLWRDGVLRNLGTLGGDFSSANDLNPRGTVVGISTLADGRYRAFIWRDGVMKNLKVPGVLSSASGINNAGVIVGERQTVSGGHRAFVWRNGITQDLPSLGGKYSTASDINPSGWIVGQSRTADSDNGGPFAVLWVPK